jgi:hypothetical protein
MSAVLGVNQQGPCQELIQYTVQYNISYQTWKMAHSCPCLRARQHSSIWAQPLLARMAHHRPHTLVCG